MKTHTADCETNDSPQETQEGIHGTLLVISRYVNAVLALVLAAIWLLTLFDVG